MKDLFSGIKASHCSLYKNHHPSSSGFRPRRNNGIGAAREGSRLDLLIKNVRAIRRPDSQVIAEKKIETPPK
ncbi:MULTISPECIES: hypothetical protein [Rhizobium]|uniref:hypothetical protein n=1 Tax=Rhizobium TaxID=379 RepID=UPI001B3435C2|nr:MULTISPECIES: hypothetical protein [Rhizobium]MBX4909818.1 hypothetical protein [Rhizobium bangladeshense]MBX5252554.1 hypothetical protein [Rhizobium sp. NLR4b]MBX5258949.1 hypothetical protein [Rhizobium sp. NLR16b]MBX5265042.1 hypothetical protein [Rhizobium sp. NLR16a]MBX5271314.1 hypothetical protein [Rhizobium sp. NLR17b]